MFEGLGGDPQTKMTADRRIKLSLVLSAAVAGIGVYFNVYDSITLSLFISAIGLVAVMRNKKAAMLALCLVVAGLFWSSMDDDGCSFWAYAGSFSHCYSTYRPSKIEEKVVDGATIELFEAGGERFWIGAGGRPLLISLLTEVFHGQDYEHARVKISPGDTVVDAGGHIGVFTKYALSRGAGKVIAIEPDPTNAACFRANLADEIQDGRVVLVEAGVWHEESELEFVRSVNNSAANSFVRQANDFSVIKKVPVRRLDIILEELGVTSVDFIKMDIEGSERFALQGSKETLQRYGPHLAICSYHLPDDSSAIPEAIEQIRPEYRVTRRDFIQLHGGGYEVGPKVLFFDVESSSRTVPTEDASVQLPRG
jgi:FkbM family methyltransferase